MVRMSESTINDNVHVPTGSDAPGAPEPDLAGGRAYALGSDVSAAGVRHDGRSADEVRVGTIGRLVGGGIAEAIDWQRVMHDQPVWKYIGWTRVIDAMKSVRDGDGVGYLERAGVLDRVVGHVTVADPEGVPCTSDAQGERPSLPDRVVAWRDDGNPRLHVDDPEGVRALLEADRAVYEGLGVRMDGQDAVLDALYTESRWLAHDAESAAQAMTKEWRRAAADCPGYHLPLLLGYISRRANDEADLLAALGGRPLESWRREEDRQAKRRPRHDDGDGYVSPAWRPRELGYMDPKGISPERGVPTRPGPIGRGVVNDIAHMSGADADEVAATLAEGLSARRAAAFGRYLDGIGIGREEAAGMPSRERERVNADFSEWYYRIPDVMLSMKLEDNPVKGDPVKGLPDINPLTYDELKSIPYVHDAIETVYDAHRRHGVVPRAHGVDLETTGLSAAMHYVIDAGWETVDLAASTPADEAITASARRSYGVPPLRALLGNPTRSISGIGTGDLEGLLPLDEDMDAQAELLGMFAAGVPYVAHSAGFEDTAFTLNVDGYADARRAGEASAIDTRKLSRRLDPGHHNDLDSYAKRWGALGEDQHERHLGLEDTHIMLDAMRRHLRSLGMLDGQVPTTDWPI